MSHNQGKMLLISLLIGTILVAAGCRKEQPKPDVREYQLRGRVESVDLVKKKVVVAHEEIEGYMKAMTMGFAVPDEKVLKTLNSGDRIEAKLIFDSRTSLAWLEQIEIAR